MKGRVLFVAGATVGYVLGARAGRRRYEQIRAGAERVWNAPPVQKGVDQVEGFVKQHAPDVQQAVVDGAKKAATSIGNRVTSHNDDAPTPTSA